MKPIKNYLLTMSSALTAMCDGLEARHVEVDFGTFGARDEHGVCYGCAATNTILQAHPDVTLDDIVTRNDTGEDTGEDGFEPSVYKQIPDLRDFELRVNNARYGKLRDLACFYNIQNSQEFDSVYYQTDRPYWCMNNKNYLEEIPKVRAFVEELKKAGL